jgi:hypothetical protein
VSAPTSGTMPRRRIVCRHWPSACTWLCTVFSPASVAPRTPISWWRIGRKCSPMMWTSASGRRWWMSATRPATEFSIGIIARSTEFCSSAAKQSSKVAHGTGSPSG